MARKLVLAKMSWEGFIRGLVRNKYNRCKNISRCLRLLTQYLLYYVTKILIQCRDTLTLSSPEKQESINPAEVLHYVTRPTMFRRIIETTCVGLIDALYFLPSPQRFIFPGAAAGTNLRRKEGKAWREENNVISRLDAASRIKEDEYIY